jgi:hypothetical protein
MHAAVPNQRNARACMLGNNSGFYHVDAETFENYGVLF